MNEISRLMKLADELFDAFYVAETLAADDAEFAKYVRAIIKSVKKEDRDLAYIALITFIKTSK